MKYFFLSDGWTTGRVWEFGGIWNEVGWQRKPHLKRLSLSMTENGEKLWLYEVEEAVLMVEVQPSAKQPRPIGQVVLKRLITAEQVIAHLCSADSVLNISSSNGSATISALEISHQSAE